MSGQRSSDASGPGVPVGPASGPGEPGHEHEHEHQGLATLDPVDVLEVAGGPRLELPAEPMDLKVALRETVLGVGDRPAGPAAPAGETCLGVWLWSRWQPSLEPRGCSREQFVDTVAGLRREVVLWLLGDRTWLQVVSSLAGRISRRLPLQGDALE